MDSKALLQLVNQISEEKGIDKEYIFESLSTALQTAYKRNFDSKTNVKVEINRDNGIVKIFSYYIVVEDYDDGEEAFDEEGEFIIIPPEINKDAQVLVEEAKQYKKDPKIGDEIEIEVTPDDFGRVAAGTARQVLMQKIREAERELILGEFADKTYELMLGMVALEDERNFYIDLGRARGVLPKEEIIPGENIEMGSSVKVYITKVESGPKGPVIKLSRKHYGFIKRLFEHEIPEMVSGDVVIASCVREPGIRCKLSVYSNNPKIDPVGACIGEKGSRISNIIKELHTEKVDLVRYSEDPKEYIKNALSPAKDVIVDIVNEETREVLAIVNKDNLSLAIGKRGTNIKLAAKLTRHKIEVKTLEDLQQN